MGTPHPEFALGEFAGFEFVRESARQVIEVDMQATGAATSALVGRALSATSLGVAGAAALSFDATAVINPRTSMVGGAITSLAAQKIAETGMSAAGWNGSAFSSGLVVRPVMAAAGQGSMQFDYSPNPGFDISSGAAVAFQSSAVATTDVQMPTMATVAFTAIGLKPVVMTAGGAASISARAQALFSVQGSLAGTSAQQFIAQPWAQTRLLIGGQATVAALAGSIANVRYALAGTASQQIFVRPVHVAGFGVPGTSAMAMSGQTNAYSATAIKAGSICLWERGGTISRFIPPAVRQVLRPFEDRALDRAFELRAVARPSENRTTRRTAS